MANSKEMILFNASRTSSNAIGSPDFIAKLLPCSQQVSLLYHVSYLCLAKFPKCEKLLRMRAVETQLLFGASEAALLKCVGTSDNLVTILFPILATAIQRKKPKVAVKYLKKAKAWISDLIGDVEQMVERYDVLNRDVAATTSDIKTEMEETKNQTKEVSQQIKEIERAKDTCKHKLNCTSKQLKETEEKIDANNSKRQEIRESANKSSTITRILAAIIPFFGLLIKGFYGPDVIEQIKPLEAELNQLNSEKNFLIKQEWNLQVQLIDWQMKLSKAKTDQGLIPDPVHLSEVQNYLSKIQNILWQLGKLWKSVDTKLSNIKDQTLAGEELMHDPDFKDLFPDLIQTASEAWTVFGGSCDQCVQIFRVQSRDAYKFLEIDPDSLSPPVWQKEYNSVMEQLKQLKVIEDGTPAIQQ